MLFKIGDRVRIRPSERQEQYSVGAGNVGTIIDIPGGSFYAVSWDKEGPGTYRSPDYGTKHQWNVGLDAVCLYEEDPTIDNHPNKDVILKIRRMNKQRKDLGYAF